MFKTRKTQTLLTALALSLPVAATAQETGGFSNYLANPSVFSLAPWAIDEDEPILRQPPGPVPAQFAGDGAGYDSVYAAAAALRQSAAFCASLPEEYLVDCIGERLGAVAAALPNTPEAAEVKAVLAEASRDIAAVTRSAQDTSKPPINARAPQPAPDPAEPDTPAPLVPTETTRPIVPVEPEAQEAVKEAAAEIIEEAQTVLLRSAEESAERAAAYIEIIAALESNKTLLRS